MLIGKIQVDGGCANFCFGRNGRIYYEMPDGRIQTENLYPALLRERGIALPE